MNKIIILIAGFVLSIYVLLGLVAWALGLLREFWIVIFLLTACISALYAVKWMQEESKEDLQ